MSDYGLEVRDADANVIIDSSTFTVREVATRFISEAALVAKVGKTMWTKPVNFPWAESRYGMMVSVTQTGLEEYPRSVTDAELAKAMASNPGNWLEEGASVASPLSLDHWLNRTPRLPVVTAYDGYVQFNPAVYAYNANVWLSLYVVV